MRYSCLLPVQDLPWLSRYCRWWLTYLTSRVSRIIYGFLAGDFRRSFPEVAPLAIGKVHDNNRGSLRLSKNIWTIAQSLYSWGAVSEGVFVFSHDVGFFLFLFCCFVLFCFILFSALFLNKNDRVTCINMASVWKFYVHISFMYAL